LNGVKPFFIKPVLEVLVFKKNIAFMKKNLQSLVLFTCILVSTFNKSNAQCTINYLKNASFEAPVQSTLGNNYPVSPTSWTLSGGTGNIVLVNGSNYFGGPNTAAAGTQYLDIVSSTGTIEQSVTTTCPSAFEFSGSFSSREAGTNWEAKIEIVNASNVVVATSTTRNFTTADADNNSPGADALWYNLGGTTAVLPAGIYTYKVFLNDFGNFDNAFLCVTPGCVLPVKVTDFKALNNKCNPNLQWKSTSEINLKQFDIEVSEDGINFTTIGTVNASGGLFEKLYNFENINQTNKVSFYRLKMIDNDGQFKVSDILTFRKNCGAENVFTVFPNPVGNTMQINFYDSKNTDGSMVKIFSATGGLIKEVYVKNGTSLVDVSSLPAGFYLLSVMTSDNIKTIKINKK
jgi:Secretion system C-terminal sorting domain